MRLPPSTKTKVGMLDGPIFDPPCFRYYVGKIACYTDPHPAAAAKQ